jgi:hypothetical protein
MGERNEHQKTLLELPEKVTALGESIRAAKKDMEST